MTAQHRKSKNCYQRAAGAMGEVRLPYGNEMKKDRTQGATHQQSHRMKSLFTR